MQILKYFFLAIIICIPQIIFSQTDFWEPINNPPVDCFFMRNITIKPNGMLFVTTDSSVYRSSNNGDSWIQTGIIDGNYIDVVNSPNGDVFALASQTVYRTSDDGVTWTKSSQITPTNLYTITIDYKNQIYVGGDGIYKSTDNGLTYLKTSGNDIQDPIITMTTNAKGHVFAGTYDYGPFRSTDEGQTWQRINSEFSGHFVMCMAISPNENIFTGAVGDSIYRSTDNGNSWKSVYKISARSIAINSIGTVFIGGNDTPNDMGVYRSSDNGNSWEKIISGLTDQFVWDLAINSKGVIFAATQSGLFRSIQPTVNVHDFEQELKNNFYLGQNYPNPFSNTTTITLTRPSVTLSQNWKRVGVRVYDALGREVKTIFEGDLDQGEHEITFNSDGLKSGQYFIRMTSGKFSKVIKTVLVK